MIISLDLPKFTLTNLFFLDTKKNMIMDGNFTKLLYSNELFVMNGLYLLFPIEHNGPEKIMNKTQIRFSPYSQQNNSIVQEFARVERKILEYYKQTRGANKKLSNLLHRQMASGIMKTTREFPNQPYSTEYNNFQYVIKISGVWETREEIGLTYKLFEVHDNYL
jgi:hypothetical protein